VERDSNYSFENTIYSTFTGWKHVSVFWGPKLDTVSGEFLPFDIAALEFQRSRTQPLFWTGIEIVERCCAGALLLVLFPALTVAGGMIVMFSKRSPLIAHPRIGQDGRPIWVLKLRTMWDRNPSQDGVLTFVERLATDSSAPTHSKKALDPRVTSRFAALCRRYSIDELPQLWHVLRGEMAFVGPRPLTGSEIDTYYGPAASLLLKKRPGLSGLWQTSGRSRLSYRQRRRLDLLMLRKWSAALYFKILLRTLPTVLSGKNAW